MKVGPAVAITAVVLGEVTLATVLAIHGWSADQIVALVAALIAVTVPQITHAISTSRQITASHEETVAQVQQVQDALRGAGVDVPPAGVPTIS